MLNRQEIKNMYVMRVKKMSQQDAIKYIEGCIFNIDMIDRWDENDRIYHDVLCEILRELQKGVVDND